MTKETKKIVDARQFVSKLDKTYLKHASSVQQRLSENGLIFSLQEVKFIISLLV